MVRECVALSIVALTPGCSLILDFDEGAASDASIDSRYTQAECDYKEPNDSVATAMVLATGETGPAAICPAMSGNPEDADFYKFTVSSAIVTVGIQFTNRALGDLDIRLLDAGGIMVAQSRGFGDGETIVCPDDSPQCPTLAPGDYLLHVFPAVPGSTNTYTISISP